MKKLIMFFILFFISFSMTAQTWTELGGTIPGIALNANNFIYSLCSDPSGNIYAAGLFTNLNDELYVAKWNGTNWSQLGGTIPGITPKLNAQISSICSDPSGNIYAAGAFGDSTGYYVVKWDGKMWTVLESTVSGGGLNANGEISTLCSDNNGNIYAAGEFSDFNGFQYVAKWDGSSWSELGGTIPGIALYAGQKITSICSDTKGHIYAGGYFWNGYVNAYVAIWNGSYWSELGGSDTSFAKSDKEVINTVASDAAGNIYAGGYFFNDAGMNYVAKWDGMSWTELGGTIPGIALNPDNQVSTICSDSLGNIYVAGQFGDTISDPIVAKWNGTVWSYSGSQDPFLGSAINSIISDVSGNIYAAGTIFDTNNKYYVSKLGASNSITKISTENVIFKKFAAYPNPAIDFLTLNVPESGIVKIHDSFGLIVISKSISAGISTIPIDNFASGFYIILFNGKDSANYAPLKIIKD